MPSSASSAAAACASLEFVAPVVTLNIPGCPPESVSVFELANDPAFVAQLAANFIASDADTELDVDLFGDPVD